MLDNERQIRAVFDNTMTVYQAYSKEIALLAIQNQKFVLPFKMERMTWIKPSFLWMMYRCGWTQKEGQENVLAIKIKREGLQWALDNSCLSHCDSEFHNSREEWKEKLQKFPVRIQWDPERDIFLEKLEYKSIQVGLSDEVVYKYVDEWIVSITDTKSLCKKIHLLVSENSKEPIKNFREAKVISQSELARLLNTKYSIIDKYERDEVKPTVDVVKRLADSLDTTIGFLLGESEDMSLLKDASILKRLNEINELPSKEKEVLLLTIDAFLRDFRTR